MYKVVLIDDEQMILQGLMKVFPWEDFQCRVVGTASDGAEGLRLIRRERPDIVLTDIRMPNMDGLSMIAALQSEFSGMKIAVLTAFRDFEYAQKALHFGVCRYLLKPSKMEELKEAFTHMTAMLPKTADVEEESGDIQSAAGNFVARAALQYIKQHYTEHISLSDVADSVYVSQWHLSKLINSDLGQSFFDIINGLRIDHAKQLLRDPSLKIQEIAFAIGYGDVGHFSKNFKKIAGVSPMEYRETLLR